MLDFTDLQGRGNQLGKYIAEELTVNLVMVKSNFAVLDRANLRKVLAEHKLTATGLVDPDNAKKLGQFAGVDALIIGTMIPKGQKVNLTVKIITTDTAEIAAAAKAEFQSDETVQKLSSQAALSEDPATGAAAPAVLASQDFGNLRVNVQKFVILNNNDVVVLLTFQNKSANDSIAAALFHEECWVRPCHLRASLVSANGGKLSCDDDDIKGITSMRHGPQALKEIEPGATIKASMQFAHNNFEGRTTSFSLEAEIVVNQNYNARDYANYQIQANILPPHCKIHNFAVELPVR